MKLILKVLFAPIVAVLALLVHLSAFVLRMSAWIFGLVGTILALLSIFVFIDSIVNGCIILFAAFLVCPFGIPMLALWMIGQVQKVRYVIQDKVYG